MLYEPETGILTVWDLETKQQRFAPVSVPFRIGDVELSPVGSTVVASGGYDGIALIFDGSTGDLRTEVEGLPRPDGGATGWSRQRLRSRQTVSSPLGRWPVRSASSTPTPERRNGASMPTPRPRTPESSARTARPSRPDTGIDRFDVASGDSLWGGQIPTEQCNSYAVAELIGAVLCGEWSGRVLAFDIETGAELGRRFDSQLGDVCALAMNPDGTRFVEVAGCSVDGVTALEWSLDGGGPVGELVATSTGDRWVEQFDGDVLVAGYADGDDEDVRTHRLDLGGGGPVTTFRDVYGLVPTADPNIAVAVFDDGEAPATIGLYDVERHRPAGDAVDPGIPVDSMWSDGQRAIVYGWGDDDIQRLRTIDLVAGEVVEPSIDFEIGGYVSGVAFAGDVFYDAYVNVTEGREVYGIERRALGTGDVLASSPPGYRNVAAGGGVVIGATVDGRVAQLDPDTLVPVGTPFPGTNGPVTNLDVDESGQRLLVKADDNSLRFFDIRTRTPLGDPINTDQLGPAALRDDGLVAAAAVGIGIVTWDLDPSTWEAAACVLARRNLTRAEWDQYIGDLAPYRRTCDQFSEGG